MAWITPKTNWSIGYDSEGNYIGDYFNVVDYNRIRNNLNEVYTASLNYFVNYPIITMPTVTLGQYTSLHTLFSNFEDNIETIFNKTYKPPGVLPGKVWVEDGKTPSFEDLNRIEEMVQLLNLVMIGQANSVRRLAFTLGGGPV